MFASRPIQVDIEGAWEAAARKWDAVGAEKVESPTVSPFGPTAPPVAFNVGDRVASMTVIQEGDHVHALPGESGVVEYVNEDGFPTIRFERTGTASIIQRIEDVRRIPWNDPAGSGWTAWKDVSPVPAWREDAPYWVRLRRGPENHLSGQPAMLRRGEVEELRGTGSDAQEVFGPMIPPMFHCQEETDAKVATMEIEIRQLRVCLSCGRQRGGECTQADANHVRQCRGILAVEWNATHGADQREVAAIDASTELNPDYAPSEKCYCGANKRSEPGHRTTLPCCVVGAVEPDSQRPHIQYTCPPGTHSIEDEYGDQCVHCGRARLFTCAVCGASEGELLPACPGHRLTTEENEANYHARFAKRDSTLEEEEAEERAERNAACFKAPRE